MLLAESADITKVKWLILFIILPLAKAELPCPKYFAEILRYKPQELAKVIENPELRASLERANSILQKYGQTYNSSSHFPPFDPEVAALVKELQNWRRQYLNSKRDIKFQQGRIRMLARRNKNHSFDSQLQSMELEIQRQQQIVDQINQELLPLRSWLGYSVVGKTASDMAKEQNFVFVLRSLHPEAIGHMMHKGYGKGMRYKFHSADEGAIAGMVPQNQKYSKKGKTASPEELAKMQAEVDQAIKNGIVVSVPHKTGSLVAVERNGKVVLVDAFQEKISQLQLVRILAEPTDGYDAAPLVSDVDPFAFAFPISENSPVIESKNYGIVTEKEKTLIREFNRKISTLLEREESRNRYMLHGAENRNPNSKGISGYPLTVFLPDGSQRAIAEGPPENPDLYYEQFAEEIAQMGYRIDPNPNW